MNSKTLVISAAALAALVVTAMMLTTSATAVGRAPLGENPAEQAEAVGAVGVEPARTRADRTPSGVRSEYRYHAGVGSLLRFALEGDTKLELRSADGTLTAGPALHLAGQLTFGVRSRERGELVVEVRGHDLTIGTCGAAGGPAAESAARTLSAQISQGALVRLSERGEVLGYRFRPETDPEARNWLRNLVDAARMLLPASEQASWTANEHDAIGLAEVAMAWSAAADHDKRPFRKKKLRYVDHGERQMRPELEHAASGTFDAQLGWVSELRSREVATLLVAEAGVTVKSHADFRFELTGTDTIAEQASGYSDTESPAAGAEDARQAHRTKQRSDWQVELEQVSTHELITALLELAKGDLASPELMAARERLIWALRLFPERIAEVVETARGQQLEDNGLMVLLAALGAARTDATQSALAGLTTPELEERTRVYALRSLFQVVEPNQKAVAAALEAAHDGRSSITASTGMLLVGAYAARDPRNTDALLAMHAEAVASKRLETWLEAIGNAGASQAFSLVEPHLAADAAPLREAALSALRGMPGDAALQALERRFEDEKVEELRGKVATLLAGRPETAGLHFADRVLESEPDDEIRIAALRGLIAKSGKPEVRARIERVANQDRSEKVRDYASRMLRERK